MTLDDLIEVVKSLKNRIQTHGQLLQKNEALTRYVLIDPLLRALGWNTEDPDLVRPEVTTQAGKPDYTLLHNGQRLAFVGAKAYGKQEDLLQQVSYCVSEGVRYFIATDGSKWEVYDTQIQKPLPEKKIAEWDISAMEPGEIIRRAFSILRHAGIGKPPDVIEWPPRKGTPISEIKHRPGEKMRYSSIVFPDGKKYRLERWKDILIESVRWLIETNRLTKPPIKVGKVKRYIVNYEPVHEDGRRFGNPITISGLFVDANYSASDIIRHTKRLLEMHSVSPKDVFVS
ncbi:MAG: hypothetical protein N3H84_00185 [Candidatus Caldarchaeum sp.]|nr:hypothetical protein [Candidatus Caldarchaeum sp.]